MMSGFSLSIKELISLEMYDIAHNVCTEELKIHLDREIIFCKIYCLIKLNKIKNAETDCKYFKEKLSKKPWDIMYLGSREYISDETGAKVNKIFWNI